MTHLRVLITILLCMILPSAVLAQVGIAEPRSCSDMHIMKKLLQEEYNEEPVATGVLANGNLFVVLASRDGSTFSVVMIVPSSRMACLVGSGQDWNQRVPGVSL